MRKSLLIVAGEISGDLHGAALLRALRRRVDGLEAWGIGGDALESEGLRVLNHVREMEVIGITEALARLPRLLRVYHRLLQTVDERRPDAAVLIDYPGFNLRLATALHRRGVRVCYYICPQVWAWRRGRVSQMARSIDHLITILPFEKDFFSETGLNVHFVGHPLIDLLAMPRNPSDPPLPWPADLHVALLPGSRMREIQHILPQLLRAARLLEQEVSEAGFLIAAPDNPAALAAQQLLDRESDRPRRIGIVIGRTHQVLREARAAWVASGTATLEAVLLRCPTVIVYRTTWITYLMARAVVRVPHIGLVNLIARRTICPELIQHQANPESLVAALRPLLHEGRDRSRMLEGYDEVVRALGGPGAAERAADVIARALVGRAPR